MNTRDLSYTNATPAGNWENTPNYGFVQPTSKRSLPFPLENTEETLITAIEALDSVGRKLQHCKEYNGLNKDNARKAHIDRMIYKLNTVMNIIKALSVDLDDMYL